MCPTKKSISTNSVLIIAHHVQNGKKTFRVVHICITYKYIDDFKKVTNSLKSPKY